MSSLIIGGSKSELASHLSSKYLNNDKNSLLVYQGCKKSVSLPQFSNVSYTLQADAVNTQVANMSKYLKNQTVVGVLIEDLDSEYNRRLNPTEDFSKWINIENVSGLLKMWADGQNRPDNGSLILLENNKQKLAIPSFLKTR
ncbi:hypothetical protein PPERSA_00689 [Pseudocohnilembus persalinus]|uniref:Uncharacterized protein n=1 Tax=Pseudocohnilembus persalinus TaxID=266149 RepID=A0A0V0QSX8_PSEPJ|nr:hypothetical protein PPERSA_00689 [Pseudocohnilembus persalinus]|eukprot:KRX05388.1 hypothetical protein PPERSA_00689 [Pseudocohnilembus persalinus]